MNQGRSHLKGQSDILSVLYGIWKHPNALEVFNVQDKLVFGCIFKFENYQNN